MSRRNPKLSRFDAIVDHHMSQRPQGGSCDTIWRDIKPSLPDDLLAIIADRAGPRYVSERMTQAKTVRDDGTVVSKYLAIRVPGGKFLRKSFEHCSFDDMLRGLWAKKANKDAVVTSFAADLKYANELLELKGESRKITEQYLSELYGHDGPEAEVA